jgi:stress-induced morphogen
MPSRVQIELDTVMRGAFLEGRDTPIVRKFFDDAKKLVAKTGEDEVKRRIGQRAKHPSGKPGGHFAAGIVTKDFKKGRTITAEYPQILRGPWLEGTSTRNESTRFKGYKLFRLTYRRLRKDLSQLIHGLFEQAMRDLNAGGGS